MSVANIKHCGEVVRVADNKVWVRMTVNSACSGCHARAVCGVDESKDRIVEVATSDAAAYSVGESVEVALESRSVGAKSVLWAYVVPFFVLTLALVGALLFGASEGVAVLSALVECAELLRNFGISFEKYLLKQVWHLTRLHCLCI